MNEPLSAPERPPASDDTGQGVTTPDVSAQERAGPDLREPLGRLVHDTRLACEADRAAAEGRQRFILEPWEGRTEHQRELDMRIGSAVATRAVHDAGLENTRRDAQLFALGAHRAAIFDALKIAVASGGYEYERKRYRAALEALGGKEEPS